jgi:hypothetical protein
MLKKAVVPEPPKKDTKKKPKDPVHMETEDFTIPQTASKKNRKKAVVPQTPPPSSLSRKTKPKARIPSSPGSVSLLVSKNKGAKANPTAKTQVVPTSSKQLENLSEESESPIDSARHPRIRSKKEVWSPSASACANKPPKIPAPFLHKPTRQLILSPPPVNKVYATPVTKTHSQISIKATVVSSPFRPSPPIPNPTTTIETEEETEIRPLIHVHAKTNLARPGSEEPQAVARKSITLKRSRKLRNRRRSNTGTASLKARGGCKPEPKNLLLMANDAVERDSKNLRNVVTKFGRDGPWEKRAVQITDKTTGMIDVS